LHLVVALRAVAKEVGALALVASERRKRL